MLPVNRLQELQDRIVLRETLKADFNSAYKANGRNVELALQLVANLRGIDKEKVRELLHSFYKKKIEKK